MPRAQLPFSLLHRSALLGFAGILGVAASAQDPAITPGTKILKREVDSLVRALRQGASDDGALGDGTCLQTAQVLTAAGHCHRFYHSGDGPWLRRAMDSLFIHRRADGAFVDGPDGDPVATTRWVLDALAIMSAGDHPSELASGQDFLARKGVKPGSPFETRIAAVRAAALASDDPLAALEGAARQAMEACPRDPATGGWSDSSAVTEALLTSVACQVAARRGLNAGNATEAAATWTPAQERGLLFLDSLDRAGVFGVQHGDNWFPDVGLTGLAVAALQTKPKTLRTDAEQATIDQGTAWLVAAQNEDGSFGTTNLNYSTSAAVLALAKTGKPEFAGALERAQGYILAIQNVERMDFAPSDRDYGSIGYGGDERGDLSNLQFAVEALRETGLDEKHEALAKAIVFLQRTQNLRTHNDFTGRTRSSDDGSWYEVAPGNDGGAAYYPGNSPAGYLELADGTRIPRSYGSMTYALLKTYTLCGIPADDPRVQAAVSWIESNWTLETNPGVDPQLQPNAVYQGLYYYYMVAAQALDTVGIAELRTDDTAVDWRAALRSHVEGLQRGDGSWLNEENGRWWEDQPVICTIYALLALSRC